MKELHTGKDGECLPCMSWVEMNFYGWSECWWWKGTFTDAGSIGDGNETVIVIPIGQQDTCDPLQLQRFVVFKLRFHVYGSSQELLVSVLVLFCIHSSERQVSFWGGGMWHTAAIKLAYQGHNSVYQVDRNLANSLFSFRNSTCLPIIECAFPRNSLAM